jgi:hypothetical protein
MFKNSSSGITPVCLRKRDVFGMVVVGGEEGLKLYSLSWRGMMWLLFHSNNTTTTTKINNIFIAGGGGRR